VQADTGKIITQKRLPRWAAGDSTVAELIAIEAALAYQTRRRPRPIKTNIATDSKQAIRHITEGISPHGQDVVRYIRKHIDALQAREGATVTLQWVPAHKGLYGNEWADKPAKKAMEEGQEEVKRAATHPANPTNPLTSSDIRTSTNLLTPTNPLTPTDVKGGQEDTPKEARRDLETGQEYKTSRHAKHQIIHVEARRSSPRFPCSDGV
jgi:ribonuclease HI